MLSPSKKPKAPKNDLLAGGQNGVRTQVALVSAAKQVMLPRIYDRDEIALAPN